MQTHFSITPAPVSEDLLWVLGPSGWVLGWMSQPQPLLDQAWSLGEPPADCPAPDLAWALRQAVGAQGHGAVALHLLVCGGSIEGRPPWWPDASRRLKPWRELALDTHVRLQSVRVLADEPGATPLWDGARQAWPQAHPLRRIDGWVWLVPRSPWAVLTASALAMGVLHLVLMGLVRPWLSQYRLQLQDQAQQAHEQERAQQTQARTQALQVEHQNQVRVWQHRQRDAMAPLEQLLRIVAQAERAEAAQWWSELRWSQDAWTIWGIASHEPEWPARQAGAIAPWQSEWIESAPTVWPPAPEWGFPAWRYQVRLEATRTDHAAQAEGVP